MQASDTLGFNSDMCTITTITVWHGPAITPIIFTRNNKVLPYTHIRSNCIGTMRKIFRVDDTHGIMQYNEFHSLGVSKFKEIVDVIKK